MLKQLQLKEIQEAFPEGKQIVNRLIRENDSKIKHLEKVIIEVYNASYDDWTKTFIVMCIQHLYLNDVVKEHNRLKRYFYMPSNDNNLTVEKAKEVKIEELFTPVKPRRSSKRITCCCPFHEDKHPSFVIYLETNSFHCFSGCGGGSSIDFVMKLHNYDFKKALEYLNNFIR